MLCERLLLRNRPVRSGERWIYSAGFNVRPDLRSTGRIDVELADMIHILRSGGRLIVLSHQGDHASCTAGHLNFVSEYLSARLGVPVGYTPENGTTAAVDYSHSLEPGTAAVFGNTRRNAGEQRNDPDLALRFAQLGDAVAVGGFSKAHRTHASNVGILRHRPGFLADSVLNEITLLRPWTGADSRFSVAVLGGVKREKTKIGLAMLGDVYDLVIPGGAVLNQLLLAAGYQVGSSCLGDDPEASVATAAGVLARQGPRRLHLPSHVVIARLTPDGYHNARTIAVRDGVPKGWEIVDFVPRPWLIERLADTGRAFIAGTPCRYADGFRLSADAILRAFAAPSVQALLLGGETVAELPWHGPVSSGGGAALHYLAHGALPIMDALDAQHRPEFQQDQNQ
jgi:phosphoglycerate kinase